MPLQPQAGPLDQYMANYGARLQSALAPPAPPAAPPSAAPPGAPPAPVSSPDHEMSFRSQFKAMPQEDQTKTVDDFEEKELKRGGQDIDSAYDTMVQQLGERPEGNLSRKDKGMLLMEFGLNLMANSARSAYGDDLPGAIGAAGSKVLSGHRSRLEGAQADYDKRRGAIEAKRADAKSELALQGSLEASRDHRYEARDIRREKREGAQVTRTVQDEDGTLYGVTRGGEVSALEGAPGDPIRAPKKAAASRAGNRGFESDARYRRYLEVNGKGPDGKPLAGEALRRVQQEALEFSKSPRSTGSNDRQWTEIFRDATRRGLSPQDARKEADSALGARQVKAPRKVAGSAPIPRRPAPQSALQALSQHPERSQEFLDKFGYLPEEYQSRLE